MKLKRMREYIEFTLVVADQAESVTLHWGRVCSTNRCQLDLTHSAGNVRHQPDESDSLSDRIPVSLRTARHCCLTRLGLTRLGLTRLGPHATPRAGAERTHVPSRRVLQRHLVATSTTGSRR